LLSLLLSLSLAQAIVERIFLITIRTGFTSHIESQRESENLN